MIVVGVDPGARSTGLAVIETEPFGYAVPRLLASVTIHNTQAVGAELLEVPLEYLYDVNAAVSSAVHDHEAALLAVESIRRPSWRTAGKAKPVDPTAIMATGIVLGGILARPWARPLVRIRPMGNGRLLPLTRYPDPLATTGAGSDKRRHERSAFDVAMMGAQSRTGVAVARGAS